MDRVAEALPDVKERDGHCACFPKGIQVPQPGWYRRVSLEAPAYDVANREFKKQQHRRGTHHNAGCRDSAEQGYLASFKKKEMQRDEHDAGGRYARQDSSPQVLTLQHFARELLLGTPF